MPEILPTAGDRTTRNCSIRHFLIALQKEKRHNAAGETVRGIIAANLSKAGWRWAEFQQLIPTGKQSGLLTRIATTERGLSLAAKKS
jgi:hypothetical protein